MADGDVEILDYNEGAQDETPVEDETPVGDEAPVEDETPVEDESPAQDETPMEEEAPAQDEAAMEGETPAQDETPAPAEPQAVKDAPAKATEEKAVAATEATAGSDPMSMPPHGTEVFISKIPREATESQVRSFCEQAGGVFDVRLTKDPGNPGQNKGYAFTLFKEKDGATAALSQLNQTELPDFPGKKVTIVKSEVKNKLFIGNMPREMTKEGILAIFSSECKGIEGMDLMLDKESPGHNRGFGFLEFYNHTAAEAARRKLGRPEYRLGDRLITVTWAEPKKNDAALEQVKSIYIGNLPDNADEAGLKNIFSAYGKITGLSLLKDPQDQNKLRNYCFLHYEDRLSALKAIEECEISKQELNGKELQVHMARPQTQRDQEAATGGYSEGYGNQGSYGGGGRGAGYSSRGGGGGGGGGGGYGTGTYAGQGGRGGYGASGGRGAARVGAASYGASAGYGARGGGRSGYGGGRGQAAYAVADEGYEGYGYEGYDEGYDEGYEEEDYSGYGYGGYAQAAGMGGMIPMMMPGGQIAYVMPSAAAAMGMGGMGGGMGMMVDPSQMAAGGAPPRRAAPGHGRGAAAAAAAASEHQGGGYGGGGSSRAGGGYGAASAAGGQASYGASAGTGAAYSGSRGAPAASSGAGGYVAGRSGRGAAYGQSSAAGRGASGYGSSARGAYGASRGGGASRYAPY